jgi:hypothetical protein
MRFLLRQEQSTHPQPTAGLGPNEAHSIQNGQTGKRAAQNLAATAQDLHPEARITHPSALHATFQTFDSLAQVSPLLSQAVGETAVTLAATMALSTISSRIVVGSPDLGLSGVVTKVVSTV